MSHPSTKQYEKVKADYEAVQNRLSALQAKQGEEVNNLARVNLTLQIHEKGVARSEPIWFIEGTTLKAR